MKFPNYGPGAQGALLQANALAEDGLRPYAEQRDGDQTIYKKGMHLYVERDEEAPDEVISDAVGGVLRMVGHRTEGAVSGYASFKGNGEDAYHLTSDLYVLPGQTDPSATWPTFWRRGLSGPAAVWAQFARGFAQAYAAYFDRVGLAWTGMPDIGEAVVVVPRPGLKPLVFCLYGMLGAGGVGYLPVQVVAAGEFGGAPVPDAVLDVFGGVPLPPQLHEIAGAVVMSALAMEAVRVAAGVPGSEWQWRQGFQQLAVGPYAVDLNRADTVVVFQNVSNLVPVAAHLRVDFSVNNSGALFAALSRVADGCPTGASLMVRGVEWGGGLVAGFGGIVPGSTGPGWTASGDATCPVLVMHMDDGRLTTVSAMRRRSISGSGVAEYELGMRVRGAVDLDVSYLRPRSGVVIGGHNTSIHQRRHSVTGSPGDWTVTTTYFSSLDYQEAAVVSRSAAGTLGRLNFVGDAGVIYVVSATEIGSGSGSPRKYSGTQTKTTVSTYSSSGAPEPPPDENRQYVAHSTGGGQTTVVVQEPWWWPGLRPGEPDPGTGSTDWETSVDDWGSSSDNYPSITFNAVDLYVDAYRFTLDLNAIYPHFGVLPPVIHYPYIDRSLHRLTKELPRADPGHPVFVDVARSVLGGEQMVARIAGLQDPDYSLAGALSGSLVETTEDAQFPNGPRVFFVGELQE